MTRRMSRILSTLLAVSVLTFGLYTAAASASSKVSIKSMTVTKSGIEVRPYTSNPALSKEKQDKAYRDYKNLTRVVMIEKYVLSAEGTKKKIGIGAGFMLPGGYIVTNNHVAPANYNGKKLRFQITFYAQKSDGYLLGTLVATDVKEDLSLLKMDANKIPKPYQDSYFKDFNLQPAAHEQVTVIGHPNKPTGNQATTKRYTWTPLYGTFTADNVAILRKSKNGSIPDIYTNSMEFKVQTWPGNSGSPVIDSSDQIVGVISSTVLGEPRSFATSSKLILLFIENNKLSEAIFGHAAEGGSS
ncbi:trypsin-like peptidase domain-containing protein [Paenibacillus tritici]|uniref:Serine protease n=1 Tax=Paenibacillus tritici TaxID=1873425 RepID=A0ABX2DQH0_9BACL|nr:serine protease [Paenibacillus tritici]NQX46111.1 trypsin-like peptidase domain-containing protein [Paenibacillus tritici]QUL52690.1 trypsin-like peptidase domain-containing protein [Paenibacillus tritici]